MTIRESDRTFIEALEATTLPPDRFDHRGHLRAAWILYRSCEPREAERRFVRALRRFARHVGQPGKYHHTVTLALLAIIRSRMSASEDWEAFVSDHRDLLDDAMGVLYRHYSPQRLADPMARSEFLEPDRDPLPESPAIEPGGAVPA